MSANNELYITKNKDGYMVYNRDVDQVMQDPNYLGGEIGGPFNELQTAVSFAYDYDDIVEYGVLIDPKIKVAKKNIKVVDKYTPTVEKPHYRVYATNQDGNGFVTAIGDYYQVEDIDIRVAMFRKDVVITIEDLTNY